ncbi:hypothetical protein F0562_022897 [Nyssa sinensis]|uniref:Uncharacterized protein n=1 Tax=Nyssa sinensis TaxID=561372 RepID=A0A5J5BEZ1_9ASTE|nr:hypothetical protein F0562_022897 [Nyssa sinensis]
MSSNAAHTRGERQERKRELFGNGDLQVSSVPGRRESSPFGVRYFLRKLKKVKKSNGQMLATNERVSDIDRCYKECHEPHVSRLFLACWALAWAHEITKEYIEAFMRTPSSCLEDFLKEIYNRIKVIPGL